jgi:solute carrier family 13 (sodium-dependent dicarboxylate transporter), member 2/3/5
VQVLQLSRLAVQPKGVTPGRKSRPDGVIDELPSVLHDGTAVQEQTRIHNRIAHRAEPPRNGSNGDISVDDSARLAVARPGALPPVRRERLGGAERSNQVPRRGGRSVVGLIVGPFVMAAIFLAPLSLTPQQHALAAVLGFSLVYWATEALPIPITSILALALCVVFDIPGKGPQDPADVVFSYFSSPTLFLLIGGFVLAQSMIKYGLAHRVALRVLAIPGVARSSYRVVIAFGALAAILSSVIADGAVAMMLLPIALGMDDELSRLIVAHSPALAQKRRLRFGRALMLMTAYGTTVGGLLTPIGDPVNLIGREFIKHDLGIHISFLAWFELAAPIVVVLFAVLCVVLLLLNKPEVGRIYGARHLVKRERRALGAMSRGEKNTAAAFGVAVCLWLLPTGAAVISGSGSPLHEFLSPRLDPSVVAIFAACLLFVLPVSWHRRQFTLTWSDAARIDWGTVILIGTGLTFGRLMVSTGLAHLIGNSIAHALGGATTPVVYIAAAATAIVISETTSNTASVGIMIPIVPALTSAVGGDALTTAVIVTFASTYGFMLPISSSANAIAFSSGRIPIMSMVISGLMVDLSGILIIVGGVVLLSHLIGLN